MASELRVNTLKDASGNNSVATSTVAQGSAKGFVRYNQSSDTNENSFNVGSISDDSAGKFTVNLSSAFATNEKPAVVGMSNEANTNSSVVVMGFDSAASSTSSLVLRVNSDDSGAIDMTQNSAAFFGDLA